MYGKKQVDIREDNKSAVIDLLLKKESTLQQIGDKLKLSHTALAKVMRELMQKDVVRVSESEGVAFGSGRPPRIYGINGEFAITCSVMLTMEKVCIYYVDMRGFQINERTVENDFPDLSSLLTFVVGETERLKSHPRLENRMLKYIYVGIPSLNFYGMNYAEARDIVRERLISAFSGIGIVVCRNIDNELIAETKYGCLKESRNAALVDLDDFLSVSLLLGGNVYKGDTEMQGLLARPFGGVRGAKTLGEAKARVKDIFSDLSVVFSFLDLNEVVFGGSVKMFGDGFLDYAREMLSVHAEFSSMGKDVPSALAGAVWLSTYSTLRAVMVRSSEN